MQGGSSKVVLTYWDGRGNGQRVRYALAAAGIHDYEEKYLDKLHALDHLKATGVLDFGQVPLLEIDGHNLVQSHAIVIYLANKANLVPKDFFEQHLCLAGYEAIRDWFAKSGYGGFGWGDREYQLKVVKEGNEKYLPFFEAYVQKMPKKTWVDFQLLYVLDYAVELFPECLEKYPKLKSLREDLRKNPEMVKFYKSSHNKGLVNEEYKKAVNAGMSPLNK